MSLAIELPHLVHVGELLLDLSVSFVLLLQGLHLSQFLKIFHQFFLIELSIRQIANLDCEVRRTGKVLIHFFVLDGPHIFDDSADDDPDSHGC